MTTKPSLADALDAWSKADQNHLLVRTWESFTALVSRVRELEAENAHNAHWHDHYGALSDVQAARIAELEQERNTYTAMTANAQERLVGALEREQAAAEELYKLRNVWLTSRTAQLAQTAARREALEEILGHLAEGAGTHALEGIIRRLLDALS